MVVDRLTKYAHFLTLSHPYTVVELVVLYMEHVFKLHEMPEDIVSDRDPTVTSKAWQEIFVI